MNLGETAAPILTASQSHAERTEVNDQWNKVAERAKPWLLAVIKSTDAASALDVSPRDGWTYM